MLRKWLPVLNKYNNKIKGDHMSAFAAQSAFFILMSIVPLTTILLELTKYFPLSEEQLIRMVTKVFPHEFYDFIVNIIDEVFSQHISTYLILSIIVGLWSAAKGIMAIRNGLNEIYDARDVRNYFANRALSAFYTMVAVILFVALMLVNTFSSQIASWFLREFPAFSQYTILILGLRGAATFVILLLLIWLMYWALPNTQVRFFHQMPGATFASLAILLSLQIYSWYIDNYGSKSYLFGSLTTIILVMIWLYMLVYIIFIGGQLNRFLIKTDFLKNMESLNDVAEYPYLTQKPVEEVLDNMAAVGHQLKNKTSYILQSKHKDEKTKKKEAKTGKADA